MNKRIRSGKSSELIVAGELIRHGIDVYVPCVDDQAIDLVIRAEGSYGIRYYDVQVKSVRGYNRIIGLKSTEGRKGRYLLVIHYRHDKKPDEFFYLTEDQINRHQLKGADWGDLIFNKQEREQYRHQTLAHLAKRILDGNL
jgi:hypothetical protein